ncbi:MAG: hypothetical protein M1824_001792 [Vezdaea acicularis]|nr:MAG: hypothetical protein M1824_001792 [Vezdaea acicularis]
MEDFKLSASLTGHEDDVRGVSYPSSKAAISASRDGSVRLWKLLSNSPPTFDPTISSHSSAFVNALTYLPPTTDYPEGLIISGGKDTIIDVRQPSKSPEDNAEALLLGHSHNICALDVDPSHKYIVSGSWDGSGRVWGIGKWETKAVLEGHEGSVWAVLAWDKDVIITGCADKLIRIFTSTGELVRKIRGASDVIRALCRIPPDHPNGAQFASASNDGVISLWTLDGRRVGQLLGHESFIYSLTSLSSGEIVSSGEDRTVRIWSGNHCIQTITHPALSVWCVAGCPENGDIITGASDRIVRIFSRAGSRQAHADTIKAFDDSVKSSSIPQQQVGEVNKEKLPGPDFLIQKSGTKEGQVQMIKEANGAITAHQWSMGGQQWVNVGTVVDGVGSSGKKAEYLGQDYDYVFDVDISEGQPALKLPYNLSQNPYEVATKFIQDNELPMTYLDQVANFITTNTQGASIGRQEGNAPPGSDPWGTESRYRPGDAFSTSQPPQSSTARSKVLPQTTYLSIKQATLKTIQKKLEQLNEQLIKEGDKGAALNKHDVDVLRKLIVHLEQSPAAAAKASPALDSGLNLILRIVTTWPAALRLPGLDLLRLLAAASPSTAMYEAGGQTVVGILGGSGVFEDLERPNNIMLAVRTFANLFESDEGRALVEKEFDQIRAFTKPSLSLVSNRNLTIAHTTLLINYSVLLTSTAHAPLAISSERAIQLLDELTTLLKSSIDNEAMYRALVASGTLLALGDEVRSAAREVFDLRGVAWKVASKAAEPRLKGVAEEIEAILESS